MSKLLSAIQKDIDHYVKLCRKYGEEPQRDSAGINPYGEHARGVIRRSIGGQPEIAARCPWDAWKPGKDVS